MLGNPENTDIKRSLHKVRLDFLNKIPDENEKTNVEHKTLIKEDDVYIIDAYIGIAARNGKIVHGSQYLSYYFDIGAVKIDNHPKSRTVTLLLEEKKEHPSESWENTVKKLENYGSSELADWAQVIIKHKTTFPKIMEKYFRLLSSNDAKFFAHLRKAKSKAIITSKILESEQQYLKMFYFCNKKSIQPLSTSYSEKLIKLMGHNVESFIVWVKKYGLPTISAGNTAGHFDISKGFLECLPLSSGPIWKGPQFDSFVYNHSNGFKQDVTIQFINISEPADDGFFFTAYFILKGEGSEIVLDKEDNDLLNLKEELRNSETLMEEETIENYS